MRQVRLCLPAFGHPRQAGGRSRTGRLRRTASRLGRRSKFREFPDKKYTLQVAVEDCTGCQLCVEVCPAKNKSAVGRKAINMEPQLPLREEGAKHWEFFRQLPEQTHTDTLKWTNVKNVQLLQPLFEFSGACAGCGETPYLKLISQLYGDRSVIANATGCSSIYGGNLPTTPWSQTRWVAARPGPTRSLRTTPSSAWGCA